MKLTPAQLRMLFKTWDSGEFELVEYLATSSPESRESKKTLDSLEKLGLVYVVDTTFPVTPGVDGMKVSSFYRATQKGMERLLDPFALMTREVLEG